MQNIHFPALIDFLQYEAPERARPSVQKLLAAWLEAEKEFNPNFVELAETYDRVMLDLTVSASWQRVQDNILGEAFAFYNDDNTIDAEATNWLNKQTWMQKFISLTLQAQMYFCSYIILDIDKRNVRGVNLIDRRYCVPPLQAFTDSLYSTKYYKVQDYPEIIPIVNIHDDYQKLGLLLKIGAISILKSCDLVNWLEYNTQFANPIVVGTGFGTVGVRSDGKSLAQKLVNSGGIRSLELGEEQDAKYIAPPSSTPDNYTALQEYTDKLIKEVIEGNNTDESKFRTYINEQALEKTSSEERRETNMSFVANCINNFLVPKLLAFGVLKTKKRFNFVILERLNATSLSTTRKITNEELMYFKYLREINLQPSKEFLTQQFGVDLVPLMPSPDVRPDPQPDSTQIEPDAKSDLTPVGEVDDFLQIDLQELYERGEITLSELEEITNVYIKEYTEAFATALIEDKNIPETILIAVQENIREYAEAKAKALAKDLGAFASAAKSFKEFQSAAQSTLDIFNNVHLQTEAQLLGATAIEMEKWYEADDDDYFELTTAGDARVRDAHAKLDGTILKKSDPRWAFIAPKNGYNCRCTLINVGADASETPPPANYKDLPDNGFAKNALITGQVFPKGQGYFSGA